METRYITDLISKNTSTANQYSFNFISQTNEHHDEKEHVKISNTAKFRYDKHEMTAI